MSIHWAPTVHQAPVPDAWHTFSNLCSNPAKYNHFPHLTFEEAENQGNEAISLCAGATIWTQDFKAYTLSTPPSCLPGACLAARYWEVKAAARALEGGDVLGDTVWCGGKGSISRESVGAPKAGTYSVFIRRAEWRNPRCLSGPWMEWGEQGMDQ